MRRTWVLQLLQKGRIQTKGEGRFIGLEKIMLDNHLVELEKSHEDGQVIGGALILFQLVCNGIGNSGPTLLS